MGQNRFLISILSFFISLASAQAAEISQAQIENEIRHSLKDIYSAEQAYYADHIAYKSNLSDLKYNLPTSLAEYVKVNIQTDKPNFQVRMTGIKAPVLKKIYSIDQRGVVIGLDPHSSNGEIETEINDLIHITVRALEAYFAEWNAYSADLNNLGVKVPDSLQRLGQLQVLLQDSSYRIEFKVSSGAMAGQVFTQESQQKAEAQKQKKKADEEKQQQEKAAEEIQIYPYRDFMPGGDRGGNQSGSPLVVVVSTTDKSIQIKEIKVWMGSTLWSSEQSTKNAGSTVFSGGPRWPCGTALEAEVTFFNKATSKTERKKVATTLNCTS